jgi:hypothetical protein
VRASPPVRTRLQKRCRLFQQSAEIGRHSVERDMSQGQQGYERPLSCLPHPAVASETGSQQTKAPAGAVR